VTSADLLKIILAQGLRSANVRPGGIAEHSRQVHGRTAWRFPEGLETPTGSGRPPVGT
jgi:hypothetical protein